MADLLLDTDIFIDHLRGAKRIRSVHHRIHYSVITRAELFAGVERDDFTVQLLLDPFRELGIDRAVAERAGYIRRESRIRLPDALIAATAIERGLDLVSRNRRDFARVKDLVTYSAIVDRVQPGISTRSEG